ncbi:MAG TPA: hypothetical protein ENK12_04660 [Gammaproteobacteria bacterium]|nr:hypothetical protein [Gammaproteobacteria bacterium]
MRNHLISAVLATALALPIGIASQAARAGDDYPLKEKLAQCEAQFKAAHSKNMTREQAAKARQKHFQLMVEILDHLNQQNMATADAGKNLSPEQVTENIRVMGHLLEMMAKDHIGPKLEWDYTY